MRIPIGREIDAISAQNVESQRSEEGTRKKDSLKDFWHKYRVLKGKNSHLKCPHLFTISGFINKL